MSETANTRRPRKMARAASLDVPGATNAEMRHDGRPNLADKRLVKTIQKRVGAALRNMRERELVQSDELRKGGLLMWAINRPG